MKKPTLIPIVENIEGGGEGGGESVFLFNCSFY